MQVDTNTRGHQQWFYFRVKGGRKNTMYTFNICNFTKPGQSGGKGYKNSEHDMRIHYKSKRKENASNMSDAWQCLTFETSQCEYVKTNVTRRKKDVLAGGADSDQEDWVEEAFNKEGAPVQQAPDPDVALQRGETLKEKTKAKK